MNGGDGSARQLDHAAHREFERVAGGLGDLLQHVLHALARQLELTHRPDERDHDLGVRVAAGLEAFDSGLGDGAHLELDEARHGQQQADPAQAEHRVGLVVLAHHGQELLIGWVQLAAPNKCQHTCER